MNIGNVQGRIEGTAVLKDKDGNIKAHIKIGGDATLEQTANLLGISPEELAKRLEAEPKSQEN